MSSRGHESIIATQKPRRDSPPVVARDDYEIVYLSGNLLEARKWEFLETPEKKRDALVDEMFKPDDLRENVSEISRELDVLITEKNPEVIHAHSTYVVFNRVLDSLREHGRIAETPLILTVHGRPKPLILPGQTRTTDYEQLSQSCPFERVLAVSENVAEQLKSHLALPSLVETCYLGIDLSVFRPILRTEKQWDLAYMGRLERMKAVDLLPQMLREVLKQIPEVRMLVTGDGSLRRWLSDELVNQGVQESVEYLGVVEADRIPQLINQCRLFLYPSREEPFGLSIVEAMACGVPVLTTNVFGPSEIVTHNVDGYMVDSDETSQLADAVVLLLSDDKLRTRLGRRGRQTAELRFSMRTHTDTLLKTYSELGAQ
jgi:glycosyltransferase involved in cell wall biosynthesis